MSTVPLPYDRVVSFYSYEISYPSLPKRGADLDAEFNAINVALDSTQSRLAEIQRDDGALGNATVHPQAITDETFVLLNSSVVPAGSWETATVYDPGDLVERSGANYLCTTTHSSDDFDVDLAAGKWQAFGGYPNAAQVVFAPAGTLEADNVQEALEELDGDIATRQELNDNLTWFSGLTPAADRLPYFNSANGMAQASFSTAGRVLIGAADAAAQRTALELVKGTAAGNVIELDGSAKLPAVDGSQLTNIVVPDASITAGKLATTLNLSGKTITMPPSLTPALTKFYESAEQTITTGGALSLAHGLSSTPKLIQCYLVCKTTEAGYAVNDIVLTSGVMTATDSASDRGVSVVSDATNISVRYASSASVFSFLRKDTGAQATVTNANWRLVIRAYV